MTEQIDLTSLGRLSRPIDTKHFNNNESTRNGAGGTGADSSRHFESDDVDRMS